MNLNVFRAALASKLGEVVTPELAAWLEANAFGVVDSTIDPHQFEPGQYRGLTFHVELFRDIESEIHPLHLAHYMETEAHRHGIPMNPDYEAFKRSERNGGLIQFTARTEGTLVGNIRMYLYTSLHTKTLSAREDTFYIYPEHRKGFTAIRFWQYMERCLEQLGVREITTDSKVVNQVGRLNEYLGYRHVANVFHKFLGE